MGLLTTPTPQEQTLQLLKNNIAGSYQQLRASFNSAVMLIWQNPYGLSPQEVLDLLGTNAYSVFAYSNAVVTLLNQAATETGETVITNVVPVGVTYTVNVDGSITLG